jgi:3-phytase
MARAGDAADDPAIWRHPRDPRRSRVLGTNKKQGLLVYDLQGRQRQLLAVGRLNNVDLRQGIPAGGQRLDLAVATRRDDNTLLLFGIAASGQVRLLATLPTDLDEIYGLCVAATPGHALEAFANDKDGRVLHTRIERVDGRWRSRVLRRFALASQPEGCVVDDARQRLFIGEEKRGIWAVDARADQPAAPQLVLATGGALVADVEGLGIYRSARAAYLVASAQGNSSFVVLDAEPPYALHGAFRIGIAASLGIDGVSETDGLELSAADFGGPYRHGLLVVQDGHKRLPQGRQNFKLVPWDAVAQALGLP